jgi:hypothetical protein
VNGGWVSSFKCLYKTLKTPVVPTSDEALFLRDIYKVFMVPDYAKEIVFQYGLTRPDKYSQHYESLETLLKCAPTDLTARLNAPKRVRSVSSKKKLVEITLLEATTAIWATLEAADTPFDIILI